MSQRLFTDQAVLDIREQLGKGMTPRQLAQTYDTTLETIRRIGRGDTYRHLGLKPLGQIELIPDSQIQQSMASLVERMRGEGLAPPTNKEQGAQVKKLRPNPMEAGGLDDPGEGQVLD